MKTSPSSSDAYLALLREFRLRPIRDDAAHRRAVDTEDSIDEHPEVSGAEMLRFLMEEQGLTQTKLSAETRLPLTTISEILSGKRGIAGSV